MSKFNPEWLDPVLHPAWLSWLRDDKNNPNNAKCLLCPKIFSLSQMGKRAITSHEEGKWHRQAVAAKTKSANIGNFFVRNSASKVTSSADNNVPILPETPDGGSLGPSTSQQHTVGHLGFLPDSDVKKAELIWAIHVVSTKQSLNNQTNISGVFSHMFPDSHIAQNMELSRTKTSYLICHALAPYFHQKVMDNVRFAPRIVVCFDESFNRISKRLQMDVCVRLWDNDKNEVVTRYWGSSFLGHSTADDILFGFKSCLQNVDLNKIVQVSMDGPHVNWSFFDKLKKEIKESDEDPDIIDAGSCGLHVVHGAFKTGFEKVGWDIAPFLKSIYNVFKDSPARRCDFSRVTGCSVFPSKFCNCRWLENGPVCDRAIQIYPHLLKYFESQKLPGSYSVTKVRDCLQDPLLLPKLHFFSTLAYSFEPFLREFQTSKPMFPFLHTAVESLLRELMGRFIKSKVLTEATSYKLTSIDIADVSTGLKLSEMGIGVATKEALRQCKTKDLYKDQFRMDCKKVIIKIVEKIIERSPIRYRMPKYATCLDPSKINVTPNQCISYLDACLAQLMNANHLSSQKSDKASTQFRRLVRDLPKDTWTNFNRSAQRLDHFYFNLLNQKEGYTELWQAVKLILLFSHGNAFVEEGFSINKDMLVENLLEDNLVAMRRAYDGVLDCGGEDKVIIDKEMIRYARGAHARYKEAQKERNKEFEKVAVSEKSRKKEEERKRALSELEKEKDELAKRSVQIGEKIKKLKK